MSSSTSAAKSSSDAGSSDKYAHILLLAKSSTEAMMSRDEVLARGIPWDSLGGAYIDEKSVDMIKKYDKKPGDRAALIEKNGEAYAKIFMILLARVQRAEYLQYIITLLDDLVQEDSERIELFWKLRDEPDIPGVPKLPFGPLFTVLRQRMSDWYLTSKACSIITSFFLKFASVSGEEKTMVFGWLAQQVCKDSDKDVLIGLTALQSLLRRNEYRESFWREGGLDTLKTVVKSDNSNIQVLYQAVNCLWLLTFNQTIRQAMTDPVLVANLCDVLKHSVKDKVIRMTLATLRNLMNIGENNEMMISCGILRALTLLSNKAWGDEDVEGDLRALFNTLEKKVNDLSSFDMYKNELLSKKLDWSSPCHRSERFWRQNVLRFEDDDYRCVRILKQILEEEAHNERALAVACWDIGEFVRYHPRGKLIMKNVNVKTSVMNLLSHESAEVRKEALLALQKLMVSNWEYLTQS
eukprot:TRINITY_DN67_c0_g1_i1.p1 TRINITY_DN67_c0_g1~~TRINITY_DN67_c0_g1_i1.p1  ORF type:complete len:466 (-),score=130.34 TRINITY_DN67_c0_g1_i1:73-1470(-)